MTRLLKRDVLARVRRLRTVAKGSGLTMAQMAIAWTLRHDSVAGAIGGASRPEQVHENVRASGIQLDDEALKQIDEILNT